MKSFSNFICNCGNKDYFTPLIGNIRKIQLNNPDEYKFSYEEIGIKCDECGKRYKNSKVEEYL